MVFRLVDAFLQLVGHAVECIAQLRQLVVTLQLCPVIQVTVGEGCAGRTEPGDGPDHVLLHEPPSAGQVQEHDDCTGTHEEQGGCSRLAANLPRVVVDIECAVDWRHRALAVAFLALRAIGDRVDAAQQFIVVLTGNELGRTLLRGRRLRDRLAQQGSVAGEADVSEWVRNKDRGNPGLAAQAVDNHL